MRRRRIPAVSIDTAPGQGDPYRTEPAAPLTADPVERAALNRALETAIATLKPDQRAAIGLRYEEGLSFEEIGQVLGIPEVTARSHVHRARKELARLLTAAGWEPAR